MTRFFFSSRRGRTAVNKSERGTAVHTAPPAVHTAPPLEGLGS